MNKASIMNINIAPAKHIIASVLICGLAKSSTEKEYL
jgi:hypothetical protein